MSNANSIQHGGDHYRAAYQHWDFVVDCGMRYLEACATKYTMRYLRKNGAEDLRKCIHFIDKITELYNDNKYTNARFACPYKIFDVNTYAGFVYKFATANNLGNIQSNIVRTLAMWQDWHDLCYARAQACALLHMVEYPSEPRSAGELHPQ